jgi:hypothetical protein
MTQPTNPSSTNGGDTTARPDAREQGEFERRSLLQLAAAAAAAGALSTSAHAAPLAAPAPARREPTGKLGDFDFLTGEWRIANRFLENGTWIEFEGEATVVGILGGLVSIEELRIPARQFSGMGLRVLDVERKLWADHWVNSKSGVVGTATFGCFENGVGTWDSTEVDGERTVVYRGVWDEITPDSCRWFQASSHDGGATWQESWVMRWTRVQPSGVDETRESEQRR